MRRRYERQRERAREPQPQRPVDMRRCAKSADGKHRWLTNFQPAACEECLEIDEKGGQ